MNYLRYATQFSHMQQNIALEYLASYTTKTQPFIEEYYQKFVKEAGERGGIPKELVERFWELARMGKKLRGSLMVLGYILAGGKEGDDILRASLSIELLHASLLIHDDVMDNCDLRRGVPSIHRRFMTHGEEYGVRSSIEQFGTSMAILTGDLGFFAASRVLSETSFPAEYKVKAGSIMNEYILRVIYGQVLDVANVAIQKLHEKDILNILRYKTAEYTGSLPLLLGATLAGCTDEKTLRMMEEYGVAFGWAFQIMDDILGVFGDPKKTGKPADSDIREGKNMLLVLYALQKANADQQQFIRRVWGNPHASKEEVSQVIEILRSSGAYQATLDLGWKYVDQGKKLIPQLTSDPHISAILDSLITYMMDRIK